jgi:pSer/pThr/pTyr-binding forkhead associated (FHA) protein
MYLEILIESQKPLIYLLNKPEIYIGSLTTNDIVVGSTGISRKHVKILVQDKSFFIIDQGSTNGTYLNNERLAPGKRFEFSPSESVRLGEHVFLNLIHEKGEPLSPLQDSSAPARKVTREHDKTQVISLKALEAAKNKKLEKKRDDLLNKKILEAKKLKEQKDLYKKIAKVLLIMFGIVVAFKYSGVFTSDKFNKKFFPKKELAKEIVFEGLEEEADFKIQSNFLITKDEMLIHFATPKCLAFEESYFCDRIPSLKGAPSGVLKVDQNLIMFINEEEWTGQTMKLLNSRVAAKTLFEESINEAFIGKLNFITFLETSLNSLLDASHQNSNFYIVFYKVKEGKPELTTFFATKGTIVPVLVTKYTEKSLKSIKDFSAYILSLDKFYHQY